MGMYASELEEIFRKKCGDIKLEIHSLESSIQVIINLDDRNLKRPLKALKRRLEDALKEQIYYGVAVQALIANRAKWKGYRSWEYADVRSSELDRIKEYLITNLCGVQD